jgi:ABC-2 type transport system permease protein
VVVRPEGRALIRVEWVKQARGWAWLTLAAMAALPSLLTAVIALTRPAIPERVGSWGSVITDESGLTAPLIALSAMQLFMLPLAVAVFAGESVAQDAAWGSLRYSLARPAARLRVLAAKTGVAATFAAVAVLLVPATALLTGVAAFGWRPLTVLDLQHTSALFLAGTTFSPGDALLRTAQATAMVAASLASTFAFALLLSTLTSSPFGAVAGGVGLGLVSRALDNVPGLHALGPWLPLTDQTSNLWTGLFQAPASLPWLSGALVTQLVYTALFMGAAGFVFSRRDIP